MLLAWIIIVNCLSLQPLFTQSFSVSNANLRKNPEIYKLHVPNHVKESDSIQAPQLKSGKLTKPEVLSPAGGWPQLKAAVVNGCDAVYFGMADGFNARARASNFPIEEVPDVMHYLHDRGVKGYMVVNILVFDEELDRLKALVSRIAEAGVDALIMQDLGAAALIHSIAPNLPIHGSTQMSITDARGVDFTQRLNLGIDRIVVGRELSLDEIMSISTSSPVELEAFVHGALCVSYSGQCFSSEAWGGRSANRGQCAQACRMPYGLIVNGTMQNMIDDAKYLLSPQDLMAVDLVPELIRAGVRSFKIEGRLKGPEYVAITTKAYREAVDEAWESISNEKHHKGFNGINDELRHDLRQVFARGQDENHDGLSRGFLEGPQHQLLVRGRSPRHRGNMIGRVVSISKRGVEVEITSPLKRGDGVVFDRNEPEDKEEGGNVYEIFDHVGNSVGINTDSEVSRGIHTLTFAKGALNLNRIRKGDIVWRNKDPALDIRIQKDYLSKKDTQMVPIHVKVSGDVGEKLIITLVDNEGRVGVGKSNRDISIAQNRPLQQKDIDKGVGQFSDTAFKLSSSIDISKLADNSFLPSAEIKVARRTAITDLITKRRFHNRADGLISDLEDNLDLNRWDMIEDKTGDDNEVDIDDDLNLGQSSQINVLCRNPKQVTAACSIPWLKEICLDFLEVHGLREAVKEVKNAGKVCVVATPRILKPDEQKLWTFFLRLKADALLIRSAGFLQQMLDLGGKGNFVDTANCTIPELRGDFSLNTANSIAANLFLDAGISKLTPTHDLNAAQIVELVSNLSEDRKSSIEPIIHQHLPIFHTEHCVFCRFLSDGNSYKDCGHPCETNDVELRDFDGNDHIVLADMGCRNTVFNAKAQSGAEYIESFINAGIKNFRVELVDEAADSVEPLLKHYKEIVDSDFHGTREQSIDNLLGWLSELPNRNGAAQGVSPGSLKPSTERQWSSLKKTARR